MPAFQLSHLIETIYNTSPLAYGFFFNIVNASPNIRFQ